MKNFFTFFFLLISFHTFAVPVFNKNMAADGTLMTIWPDHSDPNQFYFAPNFMEISYDDIRPKFHFTQYKTGNCGRFGKKFGKCFYKAMIFSFLTAGFDEDQLKEAQDGILRLVPNARFSAIPFISSEVDFGTTLNEFIESHDCSPKAGQVADEIPCSITLNQRGITHLKSYLFLGNILPFKFIYKIVGVTEGANGEYKNETLNYGLSVNFGGSLLRHHPELDVPFMWESL